MSNFIISMKNSEPCEPEYYYYGGTQPELCLNSSRGDVDWETTAFFAVKFSKKDEVIDEYVMLSDIGVDGMEILEIKTSYEAVDHQEVNRNVIKTKVKRIIDNMRPDDVKFLTSCGILNLTNVT